MRRAVQMAVSSRTWTDPRISHPENLKLHCMCVFPSLARSAYDFIINLSALPLASALENQFTMSKARRLNLEVCIALCLTAACSQVRAVQVGQSATLDKHRDASLAWLFFFPIMLYYAYNPTVQPARFP